jgi:DNA-binding CsgD family transcriptional regulator
LAFLLPHIRNAFLIHRQLGHVQELARSLREALDELSIGVVLLRRDGKVFHANTAAVAAVERTRALSLAGQVTCTVPSQMPLLQKLILDAAETGAGSGLRSGGAMKIHGFAGDLQVVITPLKFGKALDSASAVMFCSVPGETPRGIAQLLRQLHQLTPAEAAVAACLIDGMSVKEIADARGITTNTLRTQLKSIFQKTGARSQADLMRLLLGALPLLQGAAGSADS